MTPMMVAAKNSQWDTVRLLLRVGADIQLKDIVRLLSMTLWKKFTSNKLTPLFFFSINELLYIGVRILVHLMISWKICIKLELH
jgi:hypothetical protein